MKLIFFYFPIWTQGRMKKDKNSQRPCTMVCGSVQKYVYKSVRKYAKAYNSAQRFSKVCKGAKEMQNWRNLQNRSRRRWGNPWNQSVPKPYREPPAPLQFKLPNSATGLTPSPGCKRFPFPLFLSLSAKHLNFEISILYGHKFLKEEEFLCCKYIEKWLHKTIIERCEKFDCWEAKCK